MADPRYSFVVPLTDLEGVPSPPPPQGSRFFHFHIQHFRNVTTLGVSAPPGGRRPLTRNPGSVTGFWKILPRVFQAVFLISTTCPKQRPEHWRIHRGPLARHPLPPRVKILSFQHTIFSKYSRFGSRPRLTRFAPLTGNPGSATAEQVYIAAPH